MNKFTFKLPTLNGIKVLSIDFNNYAVLEVDPNLYIGMFESNVIPQHILDQIKIGESTLLDFNKHHIAIVGKNSYGYSIEFMHHHSTDEERGLLDGSTQPARTYYSLSEYAHVVLMLEDDLFKYIAVDEKHRITDPGFYYQFTCFEGIVRINEDEGLILHQVRDTVVVGREIMLDFIENLQQIGKKNPGIFRPRN